MSILSQTICGCISLMSNISALTAPAIQEGRYKLVEQSNGRRYKLKSCDGNDVDVMYVDQRGK